jgi:hypothetical protein|tara:strand:- start:9801 stop:10055 length:255 start_codon:yes stop_codon:yes gene_type:complete
MFGKRTKKKQEAVSYQIEHPKEILDLFSRLTLHHQVALLRLISRNMILDIGEETIMGYEMNYEVDGAFIKANADEDLSEASDTT